MLELIDDDFYTLNTGCKSIPHNEVVLILNDLFDFKSKFMPDDTILDAILEFSYKKGYDPIEISQELSEMEGFRNIVENDLIKNKYLAGGDKNNFNSWM